jgi:hypothetical protein
MSVSCKNCGSTVLAKDPRQKFCNHSCSASFNNRRRVGKTCAKCPKIVGWRSTYCKECWGGGAALRGRRVATVESAMTDNTRRKALIRERGSRCESCSLSEWLGSPIPLQLDHIDGNSDNNSRVNLRLLCPNCHALTPTFGNKNRANRHSTRNRRRRQHYHTLISPPSSSGKTPHS